MLSREGGMHYGSHRDALQLGPGLRRRQRDFLERRVQLLPTFAVAQTSWSEADGDGLITCGITQYRKPSEPAGPDQDVNFSWNEYFGFPPSVYDPLMTGVTAGLDVGGNGQDGVMTVNVWFFG